MRNVNAKMRNGWAKPCLSSAVHCSFVLLIFTLFFIIHLVSSLLITHFSLLILLPGVDDALEVSALQGCATDEATVDVGLGKQFRGIAGLA